MDLNTKKQITKFGAIGVAGVLGLGLLYETGKGISHLFHSSAKSNVTTTQYTAPVAPRAPVQTTPYAAAPHRDTNAEKLAKLNTLETEDVNLLHSDGFQVSSKIGPFGGTCNSNGTTDGLHWHGVSTAISYPVKRNGVISHECVEHKGGQIAAVVPRP